uniref:SIAH-type domain-containing protein n=1 Tax=Graphocephala atropunctata TaxID=36148 RepID=A0A1B6MSU1_9HEMI
MVLEVMSHLCGHAHYGCTQFLVAGCQADHELYCEWRPVWCMWCQWKGSINQFMDHVIKNHSGAHTVSTKGHIKIPNNQNAFLLKMDKVVYCLYINQKQYNPLRFCFMCYPLAKKDMNAVLSIKVVKGGLHLSQSIHPVSDFVERKDIFSDPEKFITVPKYLLKDTMSVAYLITMDGS